MEKIGILIKQTKNLPDKDNKSLIYIRDQLEMCKNIITKNPRKYRITKQINTAIQNINDEILRRNSKHHVEIKKSVDYFSEMNDFSKIKYNINIINNNYKKLNELLCFFKNNDLQAKAYLELIQNNERQTSKYLEKLNTNLSELYLKTSKYNINFVDTCIKYISENQSRMDEMSEILKSDIQGIKNNLNNISEQMNKNDDLTQIKIDIEEIEKSIILQDDMIYDQINNIL